MNQRRTKWKMFDLVTTDGSPVEVMATAVEELTQHFNGETWVQTDVPLTFTTRDGQPIDYLDGTYRLRGMLLRPAPDTNA